MHTLIYNRGTKESLEKKLLCFKENPRKLSILSSVSDEMRRAYSSNRLMILYILTHYALIIVIIILKFHFFDLFFHSLNTYSQLFVFVNYQIIQV